MSRERGEIIEISFQLKDHRDQLKMLNHPAVIISNEDVYNSDSCHLCVMITHSMLKDMFTFELKNDMFIKEFNKEGSFAQARCHLITYVYDEHINKNTSGYNRMKPKAVDRLVEHIYEKSMTNLDF